MKPATEPDGTIHQEAITRLTKDLKAAITTLTPAEVRYLVDTYYTFQENRKVADNQIRALSTSGEPHRVIDWLSNNCTYLERQVKAALLAYAESKLMGTWSMSNFGVGPIITAGFLAHFDITKAPTYGHYWSYAGLTTGFNMPVQWKKGEKRPWNASLKRLAWILSDCFVKFSGNEKCFYGQQYLEYKQKLVEKNERREFAAACEDGVKRMRRPDSKALACYKDGKLPPAHVENRARRWVSKLFIAHYWTEEYRQTYHKNPSEIYPVTHLGHAHVINSPVPSLAIMGE